MQQEPLKFPDVIAREKEALADRRQQLGITNDDGSDGSGNWFGIALSGGGIRSATINLGFLKTLHKFGILQRADYLSTVSGGGYVGSFVQTTTRAEGTMDKLFDEDKIDALRNHGEYWIPGTGWAKRWNTLQLVVAYVVSTFMSFVSPAIVFGILYFLYEALNLVLPNGSLPALPTIEHWQGVVGCGILALVGIHFVFNVLFNFDLALSRRFNFVETLFTVIGGLILAAWVVTMVKWGRNAEGRQGESVVEWTKNLTGLPEVAVWLLFAVGLMVLGLFTNPNAISFHRYYRNQLADCYLQFGKGWENARMAALFPEKDRTKTDLLAPYPLINTCLNLQNEKGKEAFKGVKASDYFLLSPLFMGSKLTGYLPTNSLRDYSAMTLPSAVAASAAAVNPGMGIYSSKLLAAMMTIFNARLGIWVSNPKLAAQTWRPTWWPLYFFRELTATIGSTNKMVNISDGGHIENLAVYELLRRQCRLIIAVDAGEDAAYGFCDLENLVVRARNELGIWIKFPDDGSPEALIRPKPSLGYSQKRYAVAELILLWESQKVQDPADGKWYTKSTAIPGGRKFGTLVYVKSSVTAPMMKPSLREDKDQLKYDTYKYKIYHPAFPHEPTGDQFFDRVQWESYYQLGQHIGADVLGLQKSPDAYQFGTAPTVMVEDLINLFDLKKPLFEETATGFDDSFIREESENESFKVGGKKKDAPPAAAPRAVVPPAPPSEAEVGYRM